MYSIEIIFDLKASATADSEDEIRHLTNYAVQVLRKTAEIWNFDIQDDVFWYYPDESYEISGRHQFGISLQLRRQVKQLKSIAYFQLIFENSCHLLRLTQSQLMLEMNMHSE